MADDSYQRVEQALADLMRPPPATADDESQPDHGAETKEEATGGGGSDLGESLRAQFGITTEERRSKVFAAVEAALRSRGHKGEVTSFRWGVITIQADPVGAKMLELDREPLLAEVNRHVDDPVHELRVRTV